MIALVIPHLRNPNTRYDIGFSIGAFTKINDVLLPLFGLLARVMPHLQLLALVIPHSGNTKVRCYPDFCIGTFYINNFVTPFTTFRSTVRGKGNPEIASIGHSVLGKPKVRYDTGFSIVFFYINTCQFRYQFLLPILGCGQG